MHRVELKGKKGAFYLPGRWQFLMHRVELKVELKELKGSRKGERS